MSSSSNSHGLVFGDMKEFVSNPVYFIMKEYVLYKNKVKEGYHTDDSTSVYSMSNLIEFCMIIFRVMFIFVLGVFGIYYSHRKMPNQSRLTKTLIAFFSFGIAWIFVS